MLFNLQFNKHDANNKLEPWSLSVLTWKEISEDLSFSSSFAPAIWGRTPRDVAKYHKGFKAEEWKLYTLCLMVPLLFKRLPMKYLLPLAKLVSVMHTLSYSEG
jgi:hypothetical protein